MIYLIISIKLLFKAKKNKNINKMFRVNFTGPSIGFRGPGGPPPPHGPPPMGGYGYGPGYGPPHHHHHHHHHGPPPPHGYW